MRKSYLLLAPALLFASLAAHADTVFNVTSSSGTSTTGSLTINTSTGFVDGSTLQFNGVSETNLSGQGLYALGGGYTLIFTGSALGTVQLNFLGLNSLQNYAGGGFKIVDLMGDMGSGTLAVAAVSSTPEPSGIALLGTGLLGIVGVVRRRLP